MIKGYLVAHLSKDNKAKNILVHRLVAESFIPNPNKYPCVNHIDGNKQNNNINNLEWCTHSENDLHAYKIGLRKASSPWSGKTGALHPRSKDYKKEVK